MKSSKYFEYVNTTQKANCHCRSLPLLRRMTRHPSFSEAALSRPLFCLYLCIIEKKISIKFSFHSNPPWAAEPISCSFLRIHDHYTC